MGRNADDGLGRLGGREAGTPNKRSMLVESLLALENIDLPSEILKCCDTLKPFEKAQVMLKLMEYVYPKKKAIAPDEFKGHQKEPTTIIFQEVGGRKEMQRLKELEEKEKKLEALLSEHPNLS